MTPPKHPLVWVKREDDSLTGICCGIFHQRCLDRHGPSWCLEKQFPISAEKAMVLLSVGDYPVWACEEASCYEELFGQWDRGDVQVGG